MSENGSVELPPITEEDIAVLLQSEGLTPELEQLIQQYQEAKSQTETDLNLLYPVGSRCAIIFSYECYELLLLPAIVLAYFGQEVQVLILTPLTIDTVPCTNYFKNKKPCYKSCSLSHGYTLPTDHVLPFEVLETEIKMEQLQYGKRVWCQKQGEEIWKLGNIIDQSHGPRWRVRLKKKEVKQKKRATINVDLDHIMPFKSLSDDQSTDDEKEEWSESDREEQEEVHKPMKDPSWGSWQVHTTGFAAKMMEKMGYVQGTGLGSKGEGRIDPIKAELRMNHSNIRPGLGLETKNNKKPAKAVAKKKEQEVDLFNLANKVLKIANTEAENPKVDKTAARQTTKQTVAKLQSQLDKAQDDYIHATEAYRRNKGTQFLRKLKESRDSFEKIKSQVDQIERQMRQAKEKKNMYTF